MWQSMKHFPKWWHGDCPPDESEAEALRKCREALGDPDEEQLPHLLAAKLDAGLKLVTHEDSLNWSKFYNMLYLNVALLGGYAYLASVENPVIFDPATAVLSRPREIFLVIASLVGLLASIGFAFTLWSGFTCLGCHKESVKSIDRYLANIGEDTDSVEYPANTIFLGKEGPTRILLRWGPVVLSLLWFGLLAWSVRIAWGAVVAGIFLGAFAVIIVIFVGRIIFYGLRDK